MGTGSYEEIDIRIKGNIPFDYEDEVRDYNIFKHKLVPKHEIMNDDEKNEILKKYGVEPNQLPQILVSDPIIWVIGAKPGDLIKITRKSPTAGEYVSYRYVVQNISKQ